MAENFKRENLDNQETPEDEAQSEKQISRREALKKIAGGTAGLMGAGSVLKEARSEVTTRTVKDGINLTNLSLQDCAGARKHLEGLFSEHEVSIGMRRYVTSEMRGYEKIFKDNLAELVRMAKEGNYDKELEQKCNSIRQKADEIRVVINPETYDRSYKAEANKEKIEKRITDWAMEREADKLMERWGIFSKEIKSTEDKNRILRMLNNYRQTIMTDHAELIRENLSTYEISVDKSEAKEALEKSLYKNYIRIKKK